jgi:hypothetical protein
MMARMRRPNSTAPADAPAGTVSCGDLRREGDGRWFLGSTFLGRDGDSNSVLDSALDERAGVVAAQLATALERACGALEGWGDALEHQAGRNTLRRFQRWRHARPSSGWSARREGQPRRGDEPEVSRGELAVVVRLADELERACEAMTLAGMVTAANFVRRTLLRYERWQATGEWS